MQAQVLPYAEQPSMVYEQSRKFVAVGSGRSVADMKTFRDTVWVTDPRTFVESHTNCSGTRGANWISGFGSSGGSMNGWYTPNHPLPDLSMRAYQVTGPRSNHTGGAMIGNDGKVTYEEYAAAWDALRGGRGQGGPTGRGSGGHSHGDEHAMADPGAAR